MCISRKRTLNLTHLNFYTIKQLAQHEQHNTKQCNKIINQKQVMGKRSYNNTHTRVLRIGTVHLLILANYSYMQLHH